MILDIQAGPRVHAQVVYKVLKILIDFPRFDFDTYTDRMHITFQSPPPIHELPCGQEHITKEYVLGTVHLDEASYNSTDAIIKEWLRQLGFDSAEARKHIALEMVFVWMVTS